MAITQIGTSGWSYPSGNGTWNGIFYPRRRRARARAGKFDELAFYAEHFDTVEVNSTLLRRAARRDDAEVGGAHAAGLRVLAQAVSEVHAPGDVPEGLRARTRSTSARRTSTSSARAIDPLAARGQARRAARAVPAELQERARLARLPRVAARAFSEYEVAVELRHRSWSDDPRATLTLLETFGAAWTQIDEPKFRTLDPPGLAAERR